MVGLLVVGGGTAIGQPLHAVAAWWTVYGALVDLGTLAVIGWLLRRDGHSYRGLLGPPTPAWQVAFGAVGVLAASLPAMVFSGELTSALYGEGTAPMFAVVEVPRWPAPSPSWWRRCWSSWPSWSPTWRGPATAGAPHRPAWIAATIVVVIWAAEHALYPLLVSDESLDLSFAAYRAGLVLPFLARPRFTRAGCALLGRPPGCALWAAGSGALAARRVSHRPRQPRIAHSSSASGFKFARQV